MSALLDWFLESLQRLVRQLERFEEAVLILRLAGMIGLACLQIVMRDIWGGGLSWADPLLRVMVLWVGLLGAAVATKMDKHISIDLVSHLLPKKIFSWLRVLRSVFSTGVCVMLTWVAVDFVRQEAFQGAGQGIAGIASWQLNLIFPIAFAVITLRFLTRSVRGIFAVLLPSSERDG